MKNKMTAKIVFWFNAFMLFLASPLAFAQDSDLPLDVDVDVTERTTTEEWYTNPVYLIIGALLILLIIAIVARGGRR